MICTINCGIRERIDPGKDALFVDASVDSLTEAIESLIVNEDKRNDLAHNISKIDFEGRQEISKFLNFINN